MNIPQTSDRLDLISSSRSGAGDLTGDPFGYVTGVLAVIIHASYLVLIQKSSLDSEYGPLTAQYAIATMASPVRTVEQGINTAEGRGLIPTEKFLTDFLNASTSLLTFSFFLCSLPPLFMIVSSRLSRFPSFFSLLLVVFLQLCLGLFLSHYITHFLVLPFFFLFLSFLSLPLLLLSFLLFFRSLPVPPSFTSSSPPLPLLSFCFVSTFLALSPCGSRCRSLRCFWCAP